ncbi:hypothetical protein C8R47DRAFT_1083099 [Mycena vitilis]|nr:hypothetical protein C8R47DRAFT_1083099 [Mycena vitilis]
MSRQRVLLPRAAKQSGPLPPPTTYPPVAETPGPQRKRKRSHSSTADTTQPTRQPAPVITKKQERHLKKGFKREMKRNMQTAKMNRVVMTNFSYDRAVAGQPQLDTSDIPQHSWQDNVPYSAVSSDGVVLAYYIPQAMKSASTAILMTQLLALVDNLGGKLPRIGGGGADGKGRSHASSYKVAPGEAAGVFKMTKGWHAIGHEVRTQPPVSFFSCN